MSQPTNRRETQVDEHLANIYEAMGRTSNAIAGQIDRLHELAGDNQVWVNRSRRAWKLSNAEVMEPANVKNPARLGQHAAALALVETLRGISSGLRETLADAETMYTGWSRFFLVTSSTGGHIHSSMRCGTCLATTQFGWLPSLSGLTEKDAVDEQGPRLCSVCFPSAPLEWTAGLPSDKRYCAGSDKPSAGNGRRRYAACPDCGKAVAVTTYGFIRKHTPAAK